MVTLSISPKLIRQDERLVLVPQRKYEALLRSPHKAKVKETARVASVD